MSLVTIVWSMIASACLTLAAIYSLAWLRNRASWDHLFFSLTAVSTAAFTFCELLMMRAETPDELLTVMKWGHVPLSVLVVSIIWFVRFYLGTGRLWLAWTVCGVRAVSLLLNFVVGENLNYYSLTSLRQVQFFGEPVTVFRGVPNPWLLVAQLAGLLLVIFVADASVSAWRRGERRKALMVGGSITFFVLAAFGVGVALFRLDVQAPVVLSVFYLGMVAVMGYELSRELLRAAQLVHELQASEAGLRESEARLSLAVDAAEFGVWIRDLSRNQVWASDSWRRMFGFSPLDHVDFDAVLQRVHPDDREALRQTQFPTAAGGNGGSFQREYRLTLPDGATRWISSLGRNEVDATGRPVLIRGVTREITARKHAEQEMQQMRDEIAHVGRVSMMGQLASALAHEINQPLATILRNAEAAELFLQDASPDLDEVRAILADIRSDDERAGQVIDRMRGLLKRQTLETQALDVSVLVREVVALVRVDAAARQVKIDVDVPDEVPRVRGDRVHLQQVLLNLTLNAMDALNETSLEGRRVRLAAQREGLQIVGIAVADSGPGIPGDMLAQIFDPFFTTKPNGMGMGLAISRTIIEAHGGELSAENTTGGGAAFRFTLPVAEGAAA